MRLAFHAPMKPPDHPVPSGDRAMARALIAALEAGGARVDVASDLRTRDGGGCDSVQAALIARAATLVPDLVAREGVKSPALIVVGDVARLGVKTDKLMEAIA